MSDFDFSSILSNIKTAEAKKAEMAKAQHDPKLARPIHFTISPDDDPIKTNILTKINAANLKQSDFCEYMCGLEGEKGSTHAYNIMSSVAKCDAMTGKTLCHLADFLGYKIEFRPRNF